jgi:hypothetical protein
VQLELDVEAIICRAYFSLIFGGRNSVGNSANKQLLIINLASVLGCQLVNSPTAQSPNIRCDYKMRHNITFIATIFISTFASSSLFAQVDTAEISKIEAYTKYIDSLSDNDERQNLVIKQIAEGEITQETVSTSIVGHNNKIDTTRKTKNDGFGKYTTRNIKGDTVYKILYHDNIDNNFYQSYYYKDNNLVYSKIDYQEDGIGQTFYYREEYYKDNEILFVNESPKSIDTVFRQRVTFDLRKKGKDYFDEFQVDRK